MDWFHKYNLVGGIPRLILGNVTLEVLYTNVESAIPNNMDHLKRTVNYVQVFNHVSMQESRAPHILLHFSSEFPYATPKILYASPLIEHKITGKFNVLSAAHVKTLLKTSSSDLQSWRGKQMEYFMLTALITEDLSLKLLSEPTTLTKKKQKLFDDIATSTRNQEDTVHSTFTHLHYPSKIIQSHNEILLENGSFLYMPVSKTFPAIDSLLVDAPSKTIFYIQCTVGLTHPIKYKYLKELYNALCDEFANYTHKLVFLVCEDIFAGFKLQPFVDAQGKVTNGTLDMQQYVGMIVSE